MGKRGLREGGGGEEREGEGSVRRHGVLATLEATFFKGERASGSGSTFSIQPDLALTATHGGDVATA